jgi:hypothetical protein
LGRISHKKEAGKMLWTVYIGATRGEREPISFSFVGEFPTKREAHSALLTALGGKKAVSGILRQGRSYFAVPAKK